MYVHTHAHTHTHKHTYTHIHTHTHTYTHIHTHTPRCNIYIHMSGCKMRSQSMTRPNAESGEAEEETS
jgi:hypothetical protein